MKLRHRLKRTLFKFRWYRKLNHWYLMTFHRERTLRNFREFIKELFETNGE